MPGKGPLPGWEDVAGSWGKLSAQVSGKRVWGRGRLGLVRSGLWLWVRLPALDPPISVGRQWGD